MRAVPQRTRRTDCCCSGTCRLRCAGSSSLRTTVVLICLSLLVLGVTVAVAVVVLASTGAQLTAHLNGTASELFVSNQWRIVK